MKEQHIASPDALILSLILDEPQKNIRLFEIEDLCTHAGHEIFRILQDGGDLQGLELVVPPTHWDEARGLVKEVGKVEMTEALSRSIKKEVPLQRVLRRAVTSSSVDVEELRRDLRLLQESNTSNGSGPPKKGEWKDLLKKSFENRVQEGKVYPTGIPRLDEILEGGLWVGELGFVQAPTGVGKTAWLVHMGCQALEAGTPVLHVSPEVVDYRVFLRYGQNLLKMTPTEIKALSQKSLQNRLARKIKAPLRIVNCRGSKRNLSAIIEEVYKAEAGTLIIFDAPELVLPEGDSKESWQSAGEMAMTLRDVAEEMDCALWMSSQGNRTSLFDQKNSKKSGLETIAESLKKAWSSDVHLVLNQSPGDQRAHRLQVSVEKARERENENDTRIVAVKFVRKEQRLYGYGQGDEDDTTA